MTEALVSTLATVSREEEVEELGIQGLGILEVAALAAELLPGHSGPTRDTVVSLLHDRTGGDPFVVRQLARLMADMQRWASNPTSIPVPSGVRHVISRRLQAFPVAGESLGAAAVIGREFNRLTAAEAAGPDPGGRA